MRPKPIILIILDGWGIAPPGPGNAIALAKTPNISKLINNYSAMTLRASGDEVGLSWGEMGNSEVGHLNLGVGRIFYQTLPRINKAIDGESFFESSVLKEATEHIKKNNSSLHLMGLLSSGRVHSTIDHLFSLLKFARDNKIKKVFIHVFLDGRDTIYNSGADFIKKLEEKIKEYRVGKIATLSGRFYAMDRDNRWDRTEKAYRAIVEGVSDESCDSAEKAVQLSYGKEVYDEEFIPIISTEKGQPVAKIEKNDAVIFFNYRADRARQITKAFVADNFDKFQREKIDNLFFATMTEYEKDLPVKIIFPPEEIKVSLAKVISEAGLKQLHIAETEKYAHVTFFFNGMKEEEFPGETRIIVPSPKVSSYEEKPSMSAQEITEKLIKEVMSQKYDFIVANFANADMVGHTGNMEATKEAIEMVDKCVGKIVDVALSVNGAVAITADHGNAEELMNLETSEMDKEHSNNPVPFILIRKDEKGSLAGGAGKENIDLSMVSPAGILADVAPTILKIMEIQKPDEMTGTELI